MTEIHPYTCARCGGEFLSEISPEDARAEAAGRFPHLAGARRPIDWAPICDGCYRSFLVWWESLPPPVRAAIEAEERRVHGAPLAS